MNKLLSLLLTLFFLTNISAQVNEFSNSKAKQWMVKGAFDEVIGQYVAAELDTLASDSDLDEYNHDDFKTLIIKRDTIFFGNEVFIKVITEEAKPRRHTYNIVAENDSNQKLAIYIRLTKAPWWYIYITFHGEVRLVGDWEKVIL